MKKLYITIFTILISSSAQAQVSANYGGVNGGAVVVGESTTTCDAAAEGAIRYNSATPGMEFCDGSSWASTSGGGCTAPSGCTNVGDVCADGSIFAGFVVYTNSSCEPLYVTDNNQSTSSQWKNAAGTDDISTDDTVDGQVNAANRGGVITDFPAFDLCESNTYHGKSDWYLPARDELHLLWKNRAAINANAAGNFTAGGYWSSTEYNTLYAWYQIFSNGNQYFSNKTLNLDVRCVRRD